MNLNKIILFFFIFKALFATEITLYTSQPQKQVQQVVRLFEKENPDIKIKVYRDGTTKVLNKLQAEIVSGEPKADVVMLADSVSMDMLKKEHALMKYKNAHVSDIDPKFYDKDKYYFGTKLITTGIIYNTNLVKTPPTSWYDLTKPEAKNNVIMPSPLYSGAAVNYVGTLSLNKKFGWKYFKKLAKNGAVAGLGNGSVRNAVARGERAYGIIIDYMAFGAKKKGAPVNFVFPKEGVMVITQPVAILKTTSHPKEAERFVDFLLSKKAQELSVKQNYIPVLKGVKPPKEYGDLSKIKFLRVSTDEIEKNIKKIKMNFARLFGGL